MARDPAEVLASLPPTMLAAITEQDAEAFQAAYAALPAERQREFEEALETIIASALTAVLEGQLPPDAGSLGPLAQALAALSSSAPRETAE